jgi:hypothetical protein
MKLFPSLVFVSAVLAPAAVTAASFEGKVSFKMSSGTGKSQSQEMHYNIKGDKVRMEMTGQKGAMGGMIMDTTKKTMTMIMDEQKMYMTMDLPDVAADALDKRNDKVTLEKTNETEKILGYTATKYISTYEGDKSELWLAEGLGTFMSMNSQNPMGSRGKSASKSWERALAGKDLFPLRVVGLDKAGKENFRMEVTAINKQSLPDSLFVPPATYQKLDMGGMMKGMIPGAR